MPYLFISYSRHDRPYARRLADALIAAGYDVWIDDQIDYGDNWERTIFQAIDECTGFLPVMTPDSQASSWVQRECHYAEKRGKPTFPLLLRGEEFPRYGLTQFVNVTDGELPSADFFAHLARHIPRKEQAGNNISATISAPAAGNSSPTTTPPSSSTAKHLPAYSLLSHRTITPAIQELLSEVASATTSTIRRVKAGLELNKVGDPRRGVGIRQDGKPDIDWIKIPAGDFTYQSNLQRTLPTFYISRHPITFGQFQAFVDAPDGYRNDAWWRGLPVRQTSPGGQAFPFNNHPRENVSWSDALAFSRWLGATLGYPVRLPTDVEWEKAARGTDSRQYPWGDDYQQGYANVNEASEDGGSYMFQTTAAGIYPHGASPYGVLDMAGNVWEWCLGLYDDPDDNSLDDTGTRTLRGGSWYNPPDSGRTWYRVAGDADGRTALVGFRVARPAPSAD